jgi:replicative DNA helicase
MTVSATQALKLKLPPHSIEAEAAVLGSLMLDNASWEKVGDLINFGDFYKAEHKLIFQSILRLLEQNKPADVVTVFELLKSSGEEINSGGIAYLNSLAQASPAVSNIKGYAEIIRDQSILRRLVTVSEEISTLALGSNRKETRMILDEAEAKIFKISEDRARGNSGLKDFDQLLTHVTKKISDLYENPNPSDVTGIPSGFLDL